MDNYTGSRVWSKVINPNDELMDQKEFETHYYEYTPSAGLYRGMYGDRTNTLKVQIFNNTTGYKELLLFDNLGNFASVVRITEDGSEVKSWQYNSEGDEDGRAGRLGRWFMRKLEKNEGDEVIRLLPMFVEQFLVSKLSLQDVNTLWANYSK